MSLYSKKSPLYSRGLTLNTVFVQLRIQMHQTKPSKPQGPGRSSCANYPGVPLDESTINDKRSEQKDVPSTVGPRGRAVGSVGLLQLLTFTFSITPSPRPL